MFLRNSHILTIHPSRVHDLMTLSIFTKLCIHHDKNQFQNFFITQQINFTSLSHHYPPPLPHFLQSQAITSSLFSTSIDFSILGISCKWNPMICGRLFSFTRDAIEVHPHCMSQYQYINTYQCSVSQLCLTLCGPLDGSLPGSSVHAVFHARILEWVIISFTRESSLPRD